ncbi:MAG: Pycsar system effector family protein [Bacteroidota bacterium]
MDQKKKEAKSVVPTKVNHEKNKHTDDLVDHYWGAINYMLSLIKASEVKAGLILSFYGLVFNLIYLSQESVFEQMGDDVVFYILFGLWALSICISIYYSIRCFIPIFEKNYESNIFYFGDVISAFGDIKNFSKTFYEISVDEDRVFNQLGEQVYVNSKIAADKFKSVNRSIRFLAIGLGIGFLMVLYYFIAQFF